MNGPHAHRSRRAGFTEPARSAGTTRCAAKPLPHPPAGAPASLRRLGRGWMRHWGTWITLVCFVTTQTAAVAGPFE